MTSIEPRVFLSYARSDGAAFALSLRDRLLGEGVPLWRDREGMEGGRDWWQQITAAIDRVEYLVLIMTPAALASPLVRREWRYARQHGVAVYPVKAVQALDFDALPRWMRSVHFYDLEHEWRKFVADLHVKPQSVRVPFMVEDLPPDFVPRPRETARLLAQLLEFEREEPIAITTALRGAGGFGKTALARALCHDERIQNAFDDGILWVTLGERPGDLTGRVEDLIFMLTGHRPGFASLETAASAFAELLADRELLIVIDDAWDIAHVWPFLQGGERCARIITTRMADALPVGARRVDVNAMASEEAVQLLGYGLPPSETYGPLAQRLGEWPLLLKLVNGALRERVLHQGQSLADALSHVDRALDKRGLTFFDARDAAARHAAVASTLELSLAQLSTSERARFDELAVFPEDAEIPLLTIGALWARTGGMDEFDAESLSQRLARLSLLLTLDLSQRFARVHDVVRRYLLDRLGTRAEALHRTLVDALRPAAGWSALPSGEPYAWTHLFFHLRAAGLTDELIVTALDLRWLSEKTLARTAFAVESDLRLAQALFPAQAQLDTLCRIYGQSAHLFGDCRSAAEVRATLLARLPAKLGLDGAPEPRLVPITPLPDLPHPALLRTLGSRRGAVRACAVSADGRIVATASTERRITLWDAATGSEIRQLTADGGEAMTAQAVRAMDLSADGRRLAAATDDRRLWIWDIATGDVIARLQGHTDQLTDCALSADGRWLVSASLDETLKLWDVNSGENVHTLARSWANNEHGWLVPTNEQGHWAAVLGCAVSQDGRLAASASADQSLVVWDLDSGQALAVLTGHTAAVQDCALDQAGHRVASVGSDRTLRLWNWSTGEHQAVVAHGAAVMACAFSSDGRLVVTAAADGVVRVWSADTLELLQTLTGHADWVHDCAVSVAANLIVSGANDGTARLWRLGVRADPYRQRQHEGAVHTCAAAPDGRHAFTGASDRMLLRWDVAHGQARAAWPVHEAGVRGCAVSADGTLVATASADRTIAVWRAASGERVASLTGHRDLVNACSFHPGGTLLASVSNDRTARVWDLSTRSRKLAWVAHEQWINACAVSPCGRWLLTAAADGTLCRWDLPVDEGLWEAWLVDPRPLPAERAAQALAPVAFQGHHASVNQCAFTPDGRFVVSACSDRTLRLWEPASGAQRLVLEGHLEDVNGFDIARDGGRIASVSSDGGILVWSLPDGKRRLALHVDGPLASCCWVGPDRLVAVGARGVYLFDVRG